MSVVGIVSKKKTGVRRSSDLKAAMWFTVVSRRWDAILVMCLVVLMCTQVAAFVCDGTVKLSDSQVNDEYCDCLDGTDESLTSACPNGRFTCTNDGFLPKSFSTGFVDDGICDCCDGSDEQKKRIACSNTCIESASSYMQAQRDSLAKYKEGVNLRTNLQAIAAGNRNQLQGELQWLKETGPRAYAEYKQAEAQYLSMSPQEQANPTYRSQLLQYHQYIDQLMRRNALLKGMMGLKEVVDEEATALAVKEKQKKGQRKKKGKNKETGALEDKSTDSSTTVMKMITVPSTLGHDVWLSLLGQCYTFDWDQRRYGAFGVEIDSYTIRLCPLLNATQTRKRSDSNLDDTATNEEDYKPVSIGIFDGHVYNYTTLQSANRITAEEHRTELRRQTRNQQRQGIRLTQAQQQADEIEDKSIWEQFQAAEMKRMQTDIVQLAKQQVQNVIPTAPEQYLRYTNGAPCFDAAPRSVVVKAECSDETRISSFTENGKCQYEMVFETPCACTTKFLLEWKKGLATLEEKFGKLQANNKDEL